MVEETALYLSVRSNPMHYGAATFSSVTLESENQAFRDSTPFFWLLISPPTVRTVLMVALL